jgi:diguanylate cyclase
MYHAREAHSGIEVYAAERDQYSPRRLALFGELRVAIERGALEVVYQPKAELPAGRVVGFEALLRWQDPTGWCHPTSSSPSPSPPASSRR